jgi:hypothetical protein
MTKPHRNTPFCTEVSVAVLKTSLADGMDLARPEKEVKSLDIRIILIDASVRSGFRMNSGSPFALTQGNVGVSLRSLFRHTHGGFHGNCVGNRT